MYNYIVKEWDWQLSVKEERVEDVSVCERGVPVSHM